MAWFKMYMINTFFFKIEEKTLRVLFSPVWMRKKKQLKSLVRSFNFFCIFSGDSLHLSLPFSVEALFPCSPGITICCPIL